MSERISMTEQPAVSQAGMSSSHQKKSDLMPRFLCFFIGALVVTGLSIGIEAVHVSLNPPCYCPSVPSYKMHQMPASAGEEYADPEFDLTNLDFGDLNLEGGETPTDAVPAGNMIPVMPPVAVPAGQMPNTVPVSPTPQQIRQQQRTRANSVSVRDSAPKPEEQVAVQGTQASDGASANPETATADSGGSGETNVNVSVEKVIRSVPEVPKSKEKLLKEAGDLFKEKTGAEDLFENH